MRHPRARASHRKRFPPRLFFLRQPLYGSPERRLHARRAPSDARPRVAGPKSRPRHNAIGGKLTFESRIAIGMMYANELLVSKMHNHAAARKKRKAIKYLRITSGTLPSRTRRRGRSRDVRSFSRRRRRAISSISSVVAVVARRREDVEEVLLRRGSTVP
jgi:hypothetical protein